MHYDWNPEPDILNKPIPDPGLTKTSVSDRIHNPGYNVFRAKGPIAGNIKGGPAEILRDLVPLPLLVPPPALTGEPSQER